MLLHLFGAAPFCGKRGERRMAACALRLLLACALVLAFALFPLPDARADAPHFADLTGDGALTAADAAVMLRKIAARALGDDARPDCDLTQNGAIDETDARVALFYVCGGISDIVKFTERVASGLCSEKLFDRFCYTGVIDDHNGNYRSENVAISISKGRMFDNDYTVADICVQDIACITTVFSGGKYISVAETVETMLDSCEGGIVAINGDFYVLHDYGPVIRNGVVYGLNITRYYDICVLSTSGEMYTFPYGKLNKETLEAVNPYHTWAFGPALLDENGKAKDEFRSEVQSANPRSVIGYYEPGHYAFLAVDGREEESRGMTMKELSQLCESLGFACAYNLDGGRSSILQSESGPVNDPYAGGRPISDIIAIRELPQE